MSGLAKALHSCSGASYSVGQLELKFLMPEPSSLKTHSLIGVPGWLLTIKAPIMIYNCLPMPAMIEVLPSKLR
jgi:hypothetical protein